MKYEIVKNEDDGLSVYILYKNLFDATYNPEGYDDFPEIEIVFKHTEDKLEPSIQQISTLEYFLQYSFELSNVISEYIFKEREVLLEKGFQIEQINEPKKNYRFSTIYIDDEYRNDLCFIGMTGNCSWDEEHGFGVVMLKKEIIDFGDWDCGYTMYSSNKEEKFSLAENNSLLSLTERREKITELSQNIKTDNTDNYLSLLKWLINLRTVYGYRNTELDLNSDEIIALIQSLEKLDLSNRKLESLHENFDLLLNLKEIDLSNNNLKEVPETLCNLDIDILYLAYNQLENLPQLFYKIRNLSRLNLSNNKFSKAPELLADLDKLTLLDLSNNNISSLPKSYKNLTNLTYFSISNNILELFPEVIKSWINIQLLYLNNNNLKILPNWIGEFTRLRNLGLSHNRIVKLPSSIGDIINLGELNLDNNELRKLPEKVGNLNASCSINVRNNKLSALPISIQKIKSIYIFNNNISEEKLLEYTNLKEHYINLRENDFKVELGRIRLEKKNGTYVNSKTSKFGCLGLIAFVVFLSGYLFIIKN